VLECLPSIERIAASTQTHFRGVAHVENKSEEVKANDVDTAGAYEAPEIETVISPADLEREVHYAGRVVTLG
jgi:hypothetical protein